MAPLKPYTKLWYGYRPFQYVVMDFLNEVSNAPMQMKEKFIKDLDRPGTIIDFASVDDKEYPHVEEAIVHGKFSLAEAILEEDSYEEIPRTGNAVLIEHLHTGFFFAIYENDYFGYFRVHDFNGTKEHPEEVQEMFFWGMPEGWEPIEPDAPGTRVGGVPLNADGTPYDGPWPGTDEGHYYFVAQYRLEDGHYIHVFMNNDRKTYDYAGKMKDDEDDIDPYAIALLEGQSLSVDFLLSSDGERPNLSEDVAYARKPLKNATNYHGVWVQDEAPPRDRNYEPLMHFGDGAQCNEETILDDIDYGYFNLFFNRKTGQAKVIMQCT